MRAPKGRLPVLIPYVLPGVLLVLLATLAWLQYRWLGQVSEAEREELRKSLDRRAEGLGDELDREITSLYQAARSVSSAGFDPATPAPLVDALAQWRSLARFPDLVDAVYLGRKRGSSSELLVYSTDDRSFKPTAWPSALWSLRESLEVPLPHPAMRALGGRPEVDDAEVVAVRIPTLLRDVPALVVWLPTIRRLDSSRPATAPKLDALGDLPLDQDLLVLTLARPYLTDVVLPALVERHFGSDPMRVAVADESGRSIYTRGLAQGHRLAADSADVARPFFAVRFDPARDAGGDRMFAWVLGTTERTVTSGVRDRVRVPPPPTGANPAAGDFTFRVERETIVGGPASEKDDRWQLLVQHPSGSLDEAVGLARRRNLWLSFGILSVLVAGIALVVLAARRSERLAAQKVDFVATVSHELRTPLTVIRTAAQNLSSGAVQDAARTRQYGDLIESEGRRLTEMVEQVLDYANLGPDGRLGQRGVHDVGPVVRQVLDSCAPLLAQHHIQTEVSIAPDLPIVGADETAVRRAVQNMVTNVVKYASAGGWMGVTVGPATWRGKPGVEIAVRDRGPGVPPSELAHVFDPFYRCRPALEQQIQGSGLGLSLVKRIAEAHGGAVSASSPLGQGATFSFFLPTQLLRPTLHDTSLRRKPAEPAGEPQA